MYRKSTGLILKRLNAKEYDMTLVVFTLDFGKLILIAKGAQKITSKRLPALDRLSMVKIQFSEKSHYIYLHTVDLVSSLQTLKYDLQTRTYLLLVADILEALLPMQEPEVELFTRFKQYIRDLLRDNAQGVTITFLRDALVLLGYAEVDKNVSLREILTNLENITQRDFHDRWAQLGI